MDTHHLKTSPLFCVGRREQLPFTRQDFVEKLQELGTTTGLGQATWNGHSFRSGAATWAAAVSISESQIHTLGHWRSDAYKANIEYSQEERISLSERFQGVRARCRWDGLLTCLELGEVVGHPTAGNLTATSSTCLKVGYIGGNDPKRQGQRHSPNASDSQLTNEECERFTWILGFRFLYFSSGFFHSLFISSSSCIHLALPKLSLTQSDHQIQHREIDVQYM